MNSGKKIIYIASAKKDYSRVKLFLESLKNSNYSSVLITSNHPHYFFRMSSVVLRSIYQLVTSNKKTTTVIIGFMSQPLFPFIRLLWPYKIINDFFFSLYDTVVNDKKLLSKNNIISMILKMLDRLSLSESNIVIADTKSHADYYMKHFNISDKNKFKILPIGADDRIFVSTKIPILRNTLKVAFHGNFIPLQGTEVIVRAAHILQNNKVKANFVMIGDGQTYLETVKLAKKLRVENIKFCGRKTLSQIMEIYQSVHVGLGIFGTSEKSLRVIPNKAYEIIAMKRMLISEDSKAMREYFTDKKDVILTEPGNPESLAEAIQFVILNPDTIAEVANAGHNLFKNNFSNKVLANHLINIIEG